MDLAQLRTLLHVADLGSLSKAADRLHIAQPALSRQVRLLEQELGTRLFDRHGRGMRVTETGEEVLRRAARILAEVEELRAAVGDPVRALTGRVSIGLPPTVSEVLSAPLIAAIRKAQPLLDVQLVDALSGYLADWMQRGEVDVAVLHEPQATRALRAKPLLLERLFLVGRADARLSAKRPVPFSRLAGTRLVLPGRSHGLRAVIERFAAQAGVPLDCPIEVDSLNTQKRLVQQGFGMTILPLAPIHADVAAKRLSAAPLVKPVAVRRLTLAFPNERPVSRAARFAGEAIESVVADLVRRGVWGGKLIAA
jgi:LysR family nitrogen assimilation transcriptional regulator